MARTSNYLKINDWLTVSLNANYNNNTTHKPIINPLNRCIELDPNRNYQNSDGTPGYGHSWENPWAQLHYGGFNNGWKDNLTAKGSIIITPFKGFTITGVIAPGFYWNRGKKFSKIIKAYTWEGKEGTVKKNISNDLSESRNNQRTLTKQLLLNYNGKFHKDHSIAALLGYEDYTRRYDTMSASTIGMTLDSYPWFVNANKNNETTGGSITANAYRSVFGRVNYSYANRYLFQANFRWDRSSRFGSHYRNGYFPSASAGWVISEEKFFSRVNPEAISFMKLRASYGTLGNERIGDYPYYSLLAMGNTILVDNNGQLIATNNASLNNYAIPDISWEKTASWDIGLDANFLNQRLTVNFDWYWKKTKDMLLAVQIPTFMGVDNPMQNAGDMHTKGYDLQLSWHDRIGNVIYTIGGNLSDYKSKMGNMSNTIVLDDSNGFITREGEEYKSWYGYICDGIFQTMDEIDNSPLLYPGLTRPGDLKFRDISGPDGVPDGRISPEYDRIVLGSSQPRYLYGFNFSVEWKGFELSALFQGVGKQQVRRTRAMITHTSSYYNYPLESMGKYWSYLNANYYNGVDTEDIYTTEEERANAIYPRLDTKNTKNNYTEMNSKWLFNGAYFRCKNITIAYNFRKPLLKRLHLHNLRLFVSGSDLFCINHYPKGWDPETKNNGSSYIAKSFNFGVQVGF